MMEGRLLAERFLILKTIGAGGATELSLARDTELDELVALRVLADGRAARWEALRDACREARRLAHPNIARVFDFYRSDDAAFVCREYVEGVSFGDLAARSNAEDFGLLAAVAAALEAAHGAGVVHGDLKASKILRDARGDARVVDFRIAAALRGAAAPAQRGGPASPQVRAGEAPRAADDVYSLGALIAEAIPPARTPRELGELVTAMCAERRDARPANLGQIREALAALANGDRRAADAPAAAVLRPPSPGRTRRGPAAQRRDLARPTRNLQYALAAGVFAVAALVVFVVLPRWVESTTKLGPRSGPSERGEAETAPTTAETGSASRSDVELLRARLIPLRERLEAAAVERWAPDDHARAKELEALGDAASLAADYAAARSHYREALALVEALIAQREAVFAESLEAGAIALEAGDPRRAIAAFELALAIEPGDAAAVEGARRAEGLGARLAHMSAGRAFEADAALDSARDEYAKALEVDPQYAPAREALARVEAAQADADYQSTLSLALVAMANGDLAAARGRFERARALRPDAPEVVDGLRQLRQIESSRAIASLRERAEAAEHSEEWREAASLYQTILKTQDNLPFAEEGLRRNRELARISERIGELLDDPTQLFRAKALAEAANLVELGQREAGGRPELADQVRKLQIALQLASTPISVTFESDTLTEVVIRGVATLGSFARRDVALKPGRYVVVGRRNGYRDTRSEISVIPGGRPPVVEVRCTEKI